MLDPTGCLRKKTAQMCLSLILSDRNIYMEMHPSSGICDVFDSQVTSFM